MGTPRRESILIDGVEHFFCKKCDTWKPRTEYNKNKRLFHKIHSYCKQCVHSYENRGRNKTQEEKVFKIKDSLDKQAIEGAVEILTNMGFDLDNDVSQQFIHRIKEKYNVDLS